MSTNPPQSRRTLDRTLLWVCLVGLGFSIAYPTARLIWTALRNWDWAVVLEGAGREALLNTVVMCFLSVFTSGIVGTALAFFVARYSFPGRRTLSALAYLPFALPPLVGTLSFYYLIGADGVFTRSIHKLTVWDDFSFTGPVAILLIHTYSFSVYFYAMVSASLEGMDVSQVEAARTLGASPWLAFRKVTVPMLMPALLGASLLAFMTSGASFSAPYFFGEDFRYLSVQIFDERTQFREHAALTLSVVLGCVSLLGVLIFRSRREISGTASKGTPRELRSRSGRILAGVAAWCCMAVLLLPHLNIVWLSFVNHREWGPELIPTSFTLENYTTILADRDALRPLLNSMWMAGLASIGAIAVGLPAAYLIGRRRKGGRLVNILVMIPWALPGTVVAMNLITAFNDAWLPLYSTVFILPLAYFVRFLPLWSRMATAAVEQFDPTLIEAGHTLGGSRWFCFSRIIVPLMAPSLIAATALVFASCLGEFVATILLYRPSNLPIAIQINNEWRGSGVGSAFAYSVFLMAIVTGTFVLARRFASRTI